jgi:hypothetical protein
MANRLGAASIIPATPKLKMAAMAKKNRHMPV